MWKKDVELIYRRILHERLLDCTFSPASPVMEDEPEHPDIRKVDINSVIHEDSRTFGCEWLCRQAPDDCGLSGFLSQDTGNEEIEKLIAIEIISLMVHPSSDLEASRRLSSESSLSEMLSLLKTSGYRKFYEAARRLYDRKEDVGDLQYLT